MNIKDSKDALLFEIVKIYDDTIQNLFKVYINENGKIKQKMNFKYFGSWIIILNIMIYLICLIPCIFQNSVKFYAIILLNCLLLLLLIIYEERLPYKRISQKTGVEYKEANIFDLFTLNTENINSEKLHFLIEYIDYLTSNKNFNDKAINAMSFILGFGINILTGNVAKIYEQNFIPSLFKAVLIGFMAIKVINTALDIIFFKKNKLLRIKKFIKNTLLSRKVTNIKK